MLMLVIEVDYDIEHVRKFLVLLSVYKGENQILSLKSLSRFAKLARELKR